MFAHNNPLRCNQSPVLPEGWVLEAPAKRFKLFELIATARRNIKAKSALPSPGEA